MAGPEGLELGQGRLMSNSGVSGCLVPVQTGRTEADR